MLKRTLSLALTISLTFPAFAQEAGQKAAAIIPQGTIVQVGLNSPVKSDEVKEGSRIAFGVVEPLRVGGITVIDRGATAIARVEKAKKAGAWGKGGQLIWTLEGVTATNGDHIPLAFTTTTKGDNARGTMLTGVAVTSFFLGPFGLLWGFKKGKQATIPAGQIYRVAVAEDTEISGVFAVKPASAPLATAAATPQSVPRSPARKACYENGFKVPCP